jgi:hypothetical protein
LNILFNKNERLELVGDTFWEETIMIRRFRNILIVAGAFILGMAIVREAGASEVYMLANNGDANQVWEYSGSGTSWSPITGTNTRVSEIAAAGAQLFQIATNGGPSQVWEYDGSGTDWTPITSSSSSLCRRSPECLPNSRSQVSTVARQSAALVVDLSLLSSATTKLSESYA